MKVKEYTTAFGNNPRELDAAVNKHIASGWQPYGNPYATENPVKQALEHLLLAQAMIKAEGRTTSENKPHSSRSLHLFV